MSVSRETLRRLDALLEGIGKWNSRINLVSRASLPDLRERHLVDSAQLFRHMPEPSRSWVDLGSGGGFPGLVIAILARELRPDLRVVLTESDQRKATFLRIMIADLALSATVLADRIEVLAPLAGDVVSARALAPLEKLLGLVERHIAPTGTALLLKGASYPEEIAIARETWQFTVEEVASVTSDQGALLKVKDIRRA